MTATPYHITKKIDLTLQEMKSAIKNTFKNADDDDLCLFYYSGHGYVDDGSLLPIDCVDYVNKKIHLLKIPQLRSLLDQVKGTKFVMLDSCYSGNLVLELGGEMVNKSDSQRKKPNLAAIDAKIISAFSSGLTPRADGIPEYIVITSSNNAEVSWGSEDYGIFSAYLVYCSGYDPDELYFLDEMEADTNSDGMLSHKELYLFTKENCTMADQHVQAYPTGGINFDVWGKNK